MKKINKMILTLTLSSVLLSLMVCSAKGPYLEIDGERFTEDDVRKEMPRYYEQIRKNYDQQIKRVLEQLGEKKLFEIAAKKNKMADANEYKRSIRTKVSSPSDEEIQSAYKEAQARGQLKGQSLDKARVYLNNYLISQKARGLMQKEIGLLKKQYNYTLGPVVRKQIDVAGEPTINPSGKLLVVEFSGFECPYCKKVQVTTKKIREKYKNKLKWVFKDYPLRINSPYSHVATNCVYKQDQPKFWGLFDKIFDPATPRDILKQENLKKEITTLGIDMGAFEKCVTDPAVRDEIVKDHQQGVNAGVSGIPHFFINGRPISGNRSFEVFDQIISEEL